MTQGSLDSSGNVTEKKKRKGWGQQNDGEQQPFSLGAPER